MNTLLAATWSGYFEEKGGDYADALKQAFSAISTIMWIILGIVCAIGAIYAIYLGIRLAKAEDQSKREEAKKHLITVFIAVGITIVLILFFNTLMPLILSSVKA